MPGRLPSCGRCPIPPRFQGNIWISQVSEDSEFPSYPCEQMLWSKTPVESLNTHHSAFRTAAFQHNETVGFTSKPSEGYPFGPQRYIFRSSIQSLHTCFRPASDSRCRVCPRTSLLAWWLTFGQMGIEPFSPHPLGNNNQFRSACAELPRFRIYLGTTLFKIRYSL